jgi:pimeloyl-ACP methyl ester carboxylesterase
MRKLFRHGSSLVLAIGVAVTPRVGGWQGAPAAAPDTLDFTVLSRGQAVGSQTVTVSKTADTWTVSATGNIGPPFDLATSRLQLRYSADWQPLSFSVEGMQGGQLTTLSTSFTGTSARTEGMVRGQPISSINSVSPKAIVLPTGFYPAYEALAAQLVNSAPGAAFKLFIPPLGEIGATLNRIVPHRLTSPTGPIELQEFDLTIANPGTPLDIEIWTDRSGRLARLAIPASWFVMLRSDISSVMTREETVKRPNDEELYIHGLGFEIAATMSKPALAPAPAPVRGQVVRSPAVVLVGGAPRVDRDERTSGVPVFADLAAALSDAGFLVVRYDKRGAGRSGGRTESATVADYAGDALSIVQWLRKRKDVDQDRIAMIGYAEGGPMALLAAAREKKVAALCLIGAPGQTGREITLLQQQAMLARSNEPEAVKQSQTAMQIRVIDAVIKGTGWEGIRPEVRGQAETAWFKSWLLFNPQPVIAKLKQPMLIVTGALDAQFPPDQADKLESFGQARKKLPAGHTQKLIVAGADHSLAPPRTAGDAGRQAAASGSVSPSASTPIVDWLKATLPARKH